MTRIRQRFRLPSCQRRICVVLLVGLWALQAVVLLVQALVCSPAQDELGQLTASIAIAQTGDPGYYRVNPPLGKLIAGLPLVAVRDVPDLQSASPSYFRPGNRNLETSMPGQYIAQRFDGYRWDFRIGRLPRVLLISVVTGLVLRWMMRWWRGDHGSPSQPGLTSKRLMGLERNAGPEAAPTLLFATRWCTSPLMSGHGWTIMPDALSGVVMLGLLMSYHFAEIGVSFAEHHFASDRMISVFGDDVIQSWPSPFPKQFLVGIDEQQLDLERGHPT